MSIDWLDLVGRFNDQTLRKEEWTHNAHLVVGLWHMLEYGSIEHALCFLRPSIIIRNHRVGTENSDSRGYHETITVFWLHEMQAFIQRMESRVFHQLVDQLLDVVKFRRKDYILSFYTREVLMSPSARGMYVPHHTNA